MSDRGREREIPKVKNFPSSIAGSQTRVMTDVKDWVISRDGRLGEMELEISMSRVEQYVVRNGRNGSNSTNDADQEGE